MEERDEPIYWFRNLPPLEDTAGQEYEISANSDSIAYDYARRNELWSECRQSLNANLAHRIQQEITRMGGHCAHIIAEHITPKVDHHNQMFRLEGRYTYELYFAPEANGAKAP